MISRPSAAFDLDYVGSFQSGLFYRTENPLEEVWAHVGRYATKERLNRISQDNKDIPWDAYRDYVRARVAQSVEFRAAARNGSLLTAPLPLYYSFLSLTRAFLALGPEKMPRTSHGLRFFAGADLMTSQATLVDGTFTDYLAASGVKWSRNAVLSLGDALSFIPELANDLQPAFHKVHAVAIAVRAKMSGAIHLEVFNYSGDFATNWQRSFPNLAEICKFKERTTLEITVPVEYENLDSFLPKYLMPGLLSDSAHWFLFPEDTGTPLLTRAGYYHVAMFILGSAVRYQPELILAVNSSDSETGWLLKRFLAQAERFYPQLKLWEQYGGKQVYFGL